MGLASGFKAYLKAKFPACVSDVALEPADAVVVDVMVVLHSFSPDEENSLPTGTQLCDKLFYMVWYYDHAVFCFDNAAQTPATKALEWARRGQDATPVDVEALRSALAEHRLPADFQAFLKHRNERMIVCEYVERELVRRMRMGGQQSTLRTLTVVGTGDVPTRASWRDDELVLRPMPELSAPLLGEADVSCIAAALHLREHDGAVRVHVSTVDTDLVVVALLHEFKGLTISLPLFDRKKRDVAHFAVDVHELAGAVRSAYNTSPHDYALLVLSKKTDYTPPSIKQLGDWDKYVDQCVAGMRVVNRRLVLASDDVQREHGVRVDGETAVDLSALHRTFLSACVGQRKNVKVSYVPGDGHLLRLAWVYHYYALAPVMKTASKNLDPTAWGWQVRTVDGSASVSTVAARPAMFA